VRVTHGASPERVALLDGRVAGELILRLARYGLRQLIELEASAVVAADLPMDDVNCLVSLDYAAGSASGPARS
jgi:hypothetical protein